MSVVCSQEAVSLPGQAPQGFPGCLRSFTAAAISGKLYELLTSCRGANPFEHFQGAENARAIRFLIKT